MMKKSRITIGILISILVTIPVAVIFYVGKQAAELPFLPTDLMDWLIPKIPGDLITFGIDLMVDTILALNLGNEDSTAKFFEQLMAVAIFVGIGVIAATILYLVYDRVKELAPRWPIAGLLLGLALALPLAAISNHTLTADNPFYDGPSLLVRTIWIVGLMAMWGVGINLAFQQWDDLETLASDKPTASHTDVPAAEAETPAPVVTSTVPAVEKLSRRQFLVRLGGATAAFTVVGTGLGQLLVKDEEIIALDRPFSFAEYPNANSLIIPASGTRPEYTPLDNHYRIDINSGNPPRIDGDAWRLTFKGLVENERTFTLAQLQDDYTPVNQYVTLACISNRVGGNLTSTTGWTGVSMQDILGEVRPTEEATHLRITSADGFWEILALDVIREDSRVMLAYAWDNELLRVKHGFPLRIYIPDRFGMKQPKWITEIEAIPEWEEGYWVRRGWDREAIMRATSVVDTIAVDEVYEENGQRYVPIGGIAHAGARQISKVEVQVDGGEWVEAQLREPLSETTWAIWRYDWPFEEGEHTFAVRCYDGTGEMQILETERARPSGATGIHRETETL